MKIMPETSSREIDTPKVGSFYSCDNLKREINHDRGDCTHQIKKSLAGNSIAFDEESSDTMDSQKVKIKYTKGKSVPQSHIYGSKQVEDEILGCNINNESNRFSMNIFVNTLSGRNIALVVNCFDTTGSLKMKVYHKEGTPPGQQRIIFGGKQLGVDKILLDYGVHNGATLHLVIRLRGGGSQISLIRKQICYLVGISRTVKSVDSLKEEIQEHVGILPAQQRIMYAGRQLKDGHSLSDYGIEREATVDVTEMHNIKITLNEILWATGNFDNAYLIGRGGSAKVYKGELCGRVVAIKRLNPERDQTEPKETKNFGIEVAALGVCNHPNIVKMIGYYMDENEHIIVSEYVARGSLYSLLHAPSPDDPILDWNTRLRIALDIASGMTYLHDNLHIIHRDLKAQNILLDEHLRAKVADLGVVKSRAYDDGEVYTELIGTRGYMCSEYVTTGSVGTYSDVYAFGVILLELISGKKAFNPTGRFLLANWATRIMQSGSHLDLFEPHLVGEIDESVLNNVAVLATKCVALRKEDRPSMKQIHYALHWMKEMQNAKIQ